MMIDGFDLIGSSKVSGSLIFMKDKFKIYFEPSRISKETPDFVSVSWNEKDELISQSVKFNCLEKAIKFVNDKLEKSKK